MSMVRFMRTACSQCLWPGRCQSLAPVQFSKPLPCCFWSPSCVHHSGLVWYLKSGFYQKVSKPQLLWVCSSYMCWDAFGTCIGSCTELQDSLLQLSICGSQRPFLGLVWLFRQKETESVRLLRRKRKAKKRLINYSFFEVEKQGVIILRMKLRSY